jgi:hypothetical protein
MPTSRIFPAFCRSMGLPEPVAEHRFHATRKWRFDWAWPEYRIALEEEGGVWTGGRHTRPMGFLKDMEKYNEAAALGWRILRCQPKTLCTVSTADLIKRSMGNNNND